MAPCRGSHLTSCHHERSTSCHQRSKRSSRCAPFVNYEQRCCDPLTAVLLPYPYNSRGRLAAQPSGGEGGLTTRRYPSAVVLAPKAAASSQERAGGGGFSCRARRRESHPPDVCATSTEVEARAGCIYPQRLWPGRRGAAVRCRSPGPLHPRKHAVWGA